MAWGKIDKLDDHAALRRVRDLIRPPMTTAEREEAIRLCNEALAR